MKHTNQEQESKSADEILNETGFLFDEFKVDHAQSAKNILIAMQQYADQFRNQPLPAAPAQGQREVYVWVQASERMPDKTGRYFVKRLGEPIICDCKSFSDGKMAFITTQGMVWKGYKDFEWLELQTQAPALPVPDAAKEAVGFAEWLRTFEPLTKENNQWVLESQISSQELYNHYKNQP